MHSTKKPHLLISVIIPTYNGEKTIQRAIQSVLNQEGNYQFEILVCDDLSDDNTCTIAQNLGAKVLKNKNHTGGPNKGRNNGIKNSIGQYIAFLDQDDEWLSNKILIQMKEIENGADLVSSRSIKKLG